MRSSDPDPTSSGRTPHQMPTPGNQPRGQPCGSHNNHHIGLLGIHLDVIRRGVDAFCTVRIIAHDAVVCRHDTLHTSHICSGIVDVWHLQCFFFSARNLVTTIASRCLVVWTQKAPRARREFSNRYSLCCGIDTSLQRFPGFKSRELQSELFEHRPQDGHSPVGGSTCKVFSAEACEQGVERYIARAVSFLHRRGGSLHVGKMMTSWWLVAHLDSLAVHLPRCFAAHLDRWLAYVFRHVASRCSAASD